MLTGSEASTVLRRHWKAWGKRASRYVASLAVLAGIVESMMILAGGAGAITTQPWWPIGSTYVDTAIAAAISPVVVAVDNLAIDNTRRRVETLTLSLANLQATSSQLAELLTKNPSSAVLRLQLDDTNDDISAARRMLKSAQCDLNKKLQPGFAC